MNTVRIALTLRVDAFGASERHNQAGDARSEADMFYAVRKVDGCIADIGLSVQGFCTVLIDVHASLQWPELYHFASDDMHIAAALAHRHTTMDVACATVVAPLRAAKHQATTSTNCECTVLCTRI
jgi:hypothetical protein